MIEEIKPLTSERDVAAAIEDGVVLGCKEIENGVVTGYKKTEGKFPGKLYSHIRNG